MKSLALHILDIAQNSLRANAKNVSIHVSENREKNLYRMEIIDNGEGIDPSVFSRVTDPFYTSRTTRKIGLGLHLLLQHAEQAGGSMEIESRPGKGCRVTAHFMFDHLDRPPLGDIAGIFRILMCSNPAIRFTYLHETDKGEYKIDSQQVINELGEHEIMKPLVQKLLKEMIAENLQSISVS